MSTTYIVVAKLRKQVALFTEHPNSVNTNNNFLIKLDTHPQKDEVDIDWFYDEETNTFSPEGEIIYPFMLEEPKVEEPTQLDRIEEMVSKSNATIAQEAVDAYTLELIEGGIL